VLVTPELGKWSTVGGLGVMVDELTTTLADMGHDIVVIAPFYNLDRKGRGNYLQADGILYSGRNIGVSVGGVWTEFGVHEGRVNGVKLLFLHNADMFPRPYPTLDAKGQLSALVSMAKASLEVLCQWRIVPGVVVTNDWFTGLVPAYARAGHFGAAFDHTSFLHICHNLDPSYEGRLYPAPQDGDLHWLHELPNHLLMDDTWSDIVVNPSRCAVMASDSWGTVSRSYRADLLSGSPLRHLLRAAAHPFGFPNGIPIALRESRLAALPTATHESAKAALQRRYFNMSQPDMSIPLFGFVGRITLQKGVHLILNAVEQLLHEHHGRVQFIIGGMASESDTYGCACAAKMRQLAAAHPGSFWADPTYFFTDGPLLNLGGDAGMMPSLFEPGGIVQQEHFVAGTPVLAFRTGGLKDTIQEFSAATLAGNGFLFEAHRPSDFIACTNRAISIIRSPALYARLRDNARASVIGLHTVASAWSGEIHRMERCLSAPSGGAALLPDEPPSRGSTSLVSAGAQMLPPLDAVRVFVRLGVGEIPEVTPSSSVQVAGPLVGGWDCIHELQLAPSGTVFESPLMLTPGKYTFKFVVNGQWVCSGYQHLARDVKGNANNVVQVNQPAVLAQ
jgi:starch synthase